MILYNVTVSIDDDIHDEWLSWMRSVHIPDVMKTGMFVENRFLKIHAYEEGGKSYSIQYLARNMADYERYQDEFAPALQAEHTQRYRGKFAAFRTILEMVDQTLMEDQE